MSDEPFRRCDCGNADCSLPPGRCLLCGAPCFVDTAFAICGDCAPRVHALYELERAAAVPDKCDDTCPGWAPFNETDDGSVEIQRCDTCRVYEHDDDAAEHVSERARSTMAPS